MNLLHKIFTKTSALTLIMALVCAMVVTPDDAFAKKSNKKTRKTTQTTQKKQTARSSSDIKKEKQRNEREIAETRKKLTDNEKRTRDQIDRLNSLNNQIQRQQATIADLNTTIASIEAHSVALRDSIGEIMVRDSALTARVAHSLRLQHARRSQLSSLAFLLSSSSYNESLRRLNYLRQLERAHNKKIRELRQHRLLLDSKRASLDSLSQRHTAALNQLATANSILDTRRRESSQTVNELKKEGATLNKVLAEKRKKARQLDDELNRIILEEQRRQQAAADAERKKRRQQSGSQGTGQSSAGRKSKPDKPAPAQGTAEADRVLTGSFASNKGKLLFPVAGRYTIVGTFGRQQHGDLDHVQVDNSGIDIQVSAGTRARAVFDGTVSSIFFMEGYENIIIVRHGEYLTVYAGLSSIKVAKGDKVKAGTELGTLATIDGRTVLHFEVRKERTKLNPMQWVR